MYMVLSLNSQVSVLSYSVPDTEDSQGNERFLPLRSLESEEANS